MSPSLRAIVATALAMGALVSLPQLPGIAPAGAAAVTTAGGYGGQPNAGAQGIVPEGESVEVPWAAWIWPSSRKTGCRIYITAWENGSWLDPNSPPGRRRLQWGETKDTSESKRDVEEIKRWLEVLLASSSDMREKARAACKLTGVNFIQVAIVRDDPQTGPGTAFPGTPLVLIDMGDTEKLAKNGKTSGTQNASLENDARMTLQSYLPVTLIVHEIDHMKRPKEEWAMFSPETMEGLAMDDENRVAVQLENFKPHKTDIGIFARRLERTSYTPVVYAYRPVLDIRIRVELDAAGAGLVFEQRERGQGPRFTEMSDDDDVALGGISAGQGVEEFDADLDGIGTLHDNCAHAWNPRQRDRNDDGTGDDCDPEITQGQRLTDALVDSAIDAVTRAASLAGGAPQLALVGPDIAGGIRFVRLAEVWPVSDPFGIFRSPGIGDRYLDSWIRAAVSLRLALRLFSDPFGVLSSAGIGTSSHDSFRSAPAAPKVQVFGVSIGTFSSLFGGAIVIPVWVEPRPLAGATRMPWPAAHASQWPRTFDLHRAVSSAGWRAWIPPRGQHGVGRHSSSNAARRAASQPAEGWLHSRADQRAAARGAEGAQRQTNEPPRPSVKLFFVSLGQTTGSAFKMTVVNDGNVPVWLMLNTIALKPLANVTAADVERQVKQFEGRGRVTMDVDGYCLDFPKQPPPAGMVFGLADDSLQAAMDPIDRITHAVVRLRQLGKLKPDTEDETEYAHDMVQWSIWTHREGFDQRGFAKAFVEHVRKNFAAAGDTWTREMEQAVTALTPQRWTDIQAILREAGTPQR